MELIIITGSSGSGKSIALSTLEDAGFYCIDNLPDYLLQAFSDDLINNSNPRYEKTAIGIDARGRINDPSIIPNVLKAVRKAGIDSKVIFLDAQSSILIKRFSETRRRHPLTTNEMGLNDAIRHERELLTPLYNIADIKIDTSSLNLHQLRRRINKLIDSDDTSISITLQSFGFKHGSPSDSDFMFDVRCLPNPYWHKELRPFSGKDPEIQEFLSSQESVRNYIKDIADFLEKWLDKFKQEGRSYLTISVGCTGGHHRSVYIIDQLSKQLSKKHNILTLHRNLK